MNREALRALWEAVNCLGAPDTACITDRAHGYCAAIGDVLELIEAEIAEADDRQGPHALAA
ncbi:hypothetical protein U0C82_18525 [Fulvimarina sp. 2208YS6-2-32]|uniref:Uncharacterized protein n=1 Tax=Fulvimarina uroteuthidis TaxID=3098149 RepID=A0ABU5I6W0_9HYPH|nr:hypothetical protein [Fulvimarina sp. 2208YS6-2-32]MDY8111120.1 hypothetical protein [Fulvimarina sp. 2208YS6-2-32]